MPVQVHEPEGPLPELLLEDVLGIVVLDIVRAYLLRPYVLRTTLRVHLKIIIIKYKTL